MRRLIAVVTVLFAAIVADANQVSAADEASRKLDLGAEAVKANCGDCYQGTKAGLVRGIELLHEAIAMGFEGQTKAYKLLADGYRTLAVAYSDTAIEKEDATLALRNAYDKLIELQPYDADLRYEYANLRPTDDERLIAHREVLAIDERHGPARLAVGTLLIRKGDVETALREYRRVVRQADETELEMLARLAMKILRINRLEEAERALQETIDARRSELSKRK